MNIILNGQEHPIPGQCSIAELLERLGQNTTRVVVELNNSVVPSGDYLSVKLKDGDTVEVVRLVGGG